MRAHTRDDL